MPRCGTHAQIYTNGGIIDCTHCVNLDLTKLLLCDCHHENTSRNDKTDTSTCSRCLNQQVSCHIFHFHLNRELSCDLLYTLCCLFPGRSMTLNHILSLFWCYFTMYSHICRTVGLTHQSEKYNSCCATFLLSQSDLLLISICCS